MNGSRLKSHKLRPWWRWCRFCGVADVKGMASADIVGDPVPAKCTPLAATKAR